MNWTTAADLRAQVLKRWLRGELLREPISEEKLFPLRLPLKSPTTRELAEQFDAVRHWIAQLQALPELRIEWRNGVHRVLGQNETPQALWLDNRDAALKVIGKQREAQRFDALCELTRSRQPRLLAWLTKRPLRAVELHDDWPTLLALCDWMLAHPRPGIYLRQVDIAGLHSKFIEQHRGVLGELFDLLLPPAAIAAPHTGIANFAARYGFRDKAELIRFRWLDPKRALLPGGGAQDLALDRDSFARLDLHVARVFITENEINYLAFPDLPDSLVIFGRGYGWDALAQADWLQRGALYYWGDIDSHGFAILDQLRCKFPHAVSLLMDRDTLLAHRTSWGRETTPCNHDLPRLNSAETALYDELRDNRLGPQLRLEQEYIGWQWLVAALALVAGEQLR